MAGHVEPLAAPDRPGPYLVGRAREQSLLGIAVDRVLAGQGGLVLISGEAGIGKTALVADTARAGEARGTLVLTGHCYDLTETPPYGPWIEMFRLDTPTSVQLHLPISPFQADTDRVTNQDDLFAKVRDVLRALAAERPLVLVLDDLHWADEASLDLLRFLARHLATLPVLALVTYRVEDITYRHRLYVRLPHLVREAQSVRIDLRRLSADDVRELIRRRYPLQPADEDRLIAHLEERGEGNPFYIGELLRAFEEEGLLRPEKDKWSLGDVAHERLPRFLRQVIDGRLARLGEEAHRLLAIAAVIGQEVPLTLWAAVGGADEEVLLCLIEQAVEARVLEEVSDGARVRFVHALLREALYEQFLGARRRVWHCRVAEALMADAMSDPDIVAYHFRQAGDPREIEWLVRAGERAQALYVPRVAIDHFTRVLDLARQQSHPSSPTVYRARGLAYQTLGDFAPAQADLESALALARAAGDRPGEWQGLLDLGFLWQGQDYAHSGVYYHQALDLARAIGEPAGLARSLDRLGNWHDNVEEPGVGQRYHREALGVFRELGDKHGIATTLDLLGSATFLGGDLFEAATLLRESAALARELDDRQTHVSSLTLLACCAGAYGSEAQVYPLTLAEAQSYGEQAVVLAREIDSLPSEAWALNCLANSLGFQGQYARALLLAHRGLVMAEEIGHREWTTCAHTVLGGLFLDLFAVPRARQHLERALALGREVGSRFWMAFTTSTLAAACIAQGELMRADALLAAILGSDALPSTTAERNCWHARAALVLAKGEPSVALEIVDRLIETDPNASAERVSPYLAKLRAEALVALGRLGEAEGAFRCARDTATRTSARALLWRVDAALATLYRRQARHSEAWQAASAARAVIAELAAELTDEELRTGFLRGANGLLPQVTPDQARQVAYPAGLSAREVEVLRLVATGLSNAQIAERLTLSTRTINSHLTSVYAKLGVSSRGAAVRFALDHGLR